MENKSISFDKIKLNSFFWLLASSCILTYALAVVWSNPVPALFFLNSGGVLLQLAALVFFIVLIRPNLSVIKSKLTARSRLLAGFSAIAFILKILIQAMIVIPELAEIAYTIRLYVVGFLHLLVLGMISSFILALFNEKGLLKLDSGIAAFSVFLFLAGIIGSEVLLFLQGTMLWFQVGFMPGFDLILALTTTLLPAGILGLLLSRQKNGGLSKSSL